MYEYFLTLNEVSANVESDVVNVTPRKPELQLERWRIGLFRGVQFIICREIQLN